MKMRRGRQGKRTGQRGSRRRCSSLRGSGTGSRTPVLGRSRGPLRWLRSTARSRTDTSAIPAVASAETKEEKGRGR